MAHRTVISRGAFTLPLLTALPASAAEAPRFRLVPLAGPGDANWISFGDSVNDAGQVAGQYWTGTPGLRSGPYAGLWTPPAQAGAPAALTPLVPGPSYVDSAAFGMNNPGQVVGWARGDQGLYAFLWTPHSPNASTGVLSAVPTLPGHIDLNYADAVNSAGQVAGHSVTYSGVPAGAEFSRAYLFTPASPGGVAGAVVDIGQLPGGADQTYTQDINDFGQVVGSSETAAGRHAIVWTPSSPNASTGTMTDLGDLPGGEVYASANAVNNAGVVVGTSSSAQGYQAFRWTPASPNAPQGTIEVLTPLQLAGGPNGFGLGVNDAGWVVGRSEFVGSDDVLATLWTADGTAHDLNTLVAEGGEGWKLIEAASVSNTGYITGTALIDLDPTPTRDLFEARAYLLVPIPEPAAGTTMLAAAAAILLARRRRRSR